MRNFDTEKYVDAMARGPRDAAYLRGAVDGLKHVVKQAPALRLLDSLAAQLSRFGTLPRIPLPSPVEKVSIELPIVDRCNLDCVACSHFSPLAAGVPDMEPAEAAEMLDRMPCISVDQLLIIGGEPMLHPELKEFIDIAYERRQRMKCRMVVSNCTLYDKVRDWLPDELARTGTMLAFSDYVANRKHLDRVIADRDKRFSTIRFGESPAVFNRYLKSTDCRYALDKHLCGQRVCLTLRGGRLWACSSVACISTLNAAYGTAIMPSEFDSWRIEDIECRDDLVILQNLPNPFCRHCDTAGSGTMRHSFARPAREHYLVE